MLPLSGGYRPVRYIFLNNPNVIDWHHVYNHVSVVDAFIATPFKGNGAAAATSDAKSLTEDTTIQSIVVGIWTTARAMVQDSSKPRKYTEVTYANTGAGVSFQKRNEHKTQDSRRVVYSCTPPRRYYPSTGHASPQAHGLLLRSFTVPWFLSVLISMPSPSLALSNTPNC
jgi:hypothetical protein